MPHAFAEIAFTPSVKAAQAADGSRDSYERNFGGSFDYNLELSTAEAEFIESQRSVFMATVSETGWPYVQHRGGPKGFVRVLDERTIAFLDYVGNRQLISVGNTAINPRVAMIFLDYSQKVRLKVLGRLTFSPITGEDELVTRLLNRGYRAKPQRVAKITVDGYDWNCSQHIPVRVDIEEVEAAIASRDAVIASLKARLDELTSGPKPG